MIWYNKEIIMKELKNSFKEIWNEHRGLLMIMVVTSILSLLLLVASLVTLSPSAAVVKVGYGDIGSYQGGDFSEMQSAGGYRDGNWTTMLTFSVLALSIGILHNVIAVKLYKRRGASIAGTFLGITIGLIISAFIVLFRLLGEG